jgi:cell wall-associated NlpC family hydrolase
MQRMASKRTAAGFVSYVSTLFLLTFACSSAFARPLLPPELPTLDLPEVSALISAREPSRLDVTSTHAAAAPETGATPGSEGAPATPSNSEVAPRRALADFAMKLRNIAYRRGGREISTGFDCSGFVRYVFRHSLGLDLPSDSASQFHAGSHVDREALKMGDLVFFRTQGKRVSHVGIYLDNGLFIHSPSNGKRVRIDHLAEGYWSKRFVGAKRPDALALDAPKANVRASAG